MIYAWDAILHHVARAVSEAAGIDVKEDEFTTPPDSKLGDLAFGCFTLAKAQGKNPTDIAKGLAEKLKKGDFSIESAAAAGPYLNLVLKTGDLVSRVVKEIETHKSEYGTSDVGKRRQIMLEYAQPNTHKEIHVGHLRNLVLGASLARILQANGWEVVTASYHGDVGAHVAKCLWFFVRKHASTVKQVLPKKKKKGDEAAPRSEDAWADHQVANLTVDAVEAMLKVVPKADRNGRYLGALYTEATKFLEENTEWKTQVSEVQRNLESKNPVWIKLWQETRRWSFTEFDAIFQDLGVMIDRRYLESEVVDDGQRIVDELLQKGVARESQGAIIVDLEDLKLGVFLVRKSDGTSLYATKDLALAALKFKEYPKLERSLHVVDNRQSLYFKQLAETLKRMGFTKQLEFVGYEFVTLKAGAMSSREGNIVTWQDFRDEVLAFATKETQKRHPDWNEGRVTHTAWRLMMGGVKFGMLRQDSEKVFTFDLEKALSFDGATGPYVQYAATRLGSILRKAGWSPEKGLQAGDPSVLATPAEKRLALAMARFPRMVEATATGLRPAVLAQWCLDMATRCNEFYRDVNVIESEFDVKQARFRLVASARTVLMLGLNLLGIPIPEEM